MSIALNSLGFVATVRDSSNCRPVAAANLLVPMFIFYIYARRGPYCLRGINNTICQSTETIPWEHWPGRKSALAKFQVTRWRDMEDTQAGKEVFLGLRPRARFEVQ